MKQKEHTEDVIDTPTSLSVLTEAAHEVSERRDADVYILSGAITRETAIQLIRHHSEAAGRENGILVLSTYGGDPDAAYIIARFFRRVYKSFILHVFGHCKSAGTLIALGAHEIVMSSYGELGPLDVQHFRDDEFMLRSSGLDVFQALGVLSSQMFEMFENHFLAIKRHSSGLITTKTAADIASTLAVGLITPISAQVDPIRLGEVQRSISIANYYGERLGSKAETIQRLVASYPSHSFVIDIDEAKELFGNVREPEEDELKLEFALRLYLKEQTNYECIRTPIPKDVVVGYIDTGANTEGDSHEGQTDMSNGSEVVSDTQATAAVHVNGSNDQGPAQEGVSDNPAFQ